MVASLRKREEEVKEQMAGHLRDRDKERDQHLHNEAGTPQATEYLHGTVVLYYTVV